MTDRPRAHPTLLAAVAQAVPARIAKKLDGSPRAAEAWTWARADARWTVTTDGGETVTLHAEVVSEVGQLACSCLLSPRCFHVLAVAAALAVDAGEAPAAPEPSAEPPAPPDEVAAAPATFAPSEAQAAAGRAALAAADAVLAAGASGVGVVLLGELLRAGHAARVAGLPRLASAASRVAESARALREEKPEFTLGAFTAAIAELAEVAGAFARGRPSSAHVGVARREYEGVGNLRVVGLGCEPVIASGYAGVVSYVVDGAGRIWTLNEIVPAADPGRALSAYGMSVRIGDTSVPHRALVREGLFVEGATGSRDLRLGAGNKPKAVRTGPTTPDDAALAALFAPPLEAQVARAYAALGAPLEERAASSSLVFVDVVVLGEAGRALAVAARRPDEEPIRLRLVPPSDASSLAYVDNLRALARAPGLRLRVAGHLVPASPRTLAAVIVLAPPTAPDEPSAAGAARLALPADWGGRVCLGLDRLQSAHFARGGDVAAAPPALAAVAGSAPDPLAALRRRLERLAMGGARTLGPGALRSVDHERAALARAMMPEAARALGALATAAARRERLADAWLSLAVYERTATRHLWRAAWGA